MNEDDSHAWLWIILVIALLIILTAGAYYAYNTITQNKPRNYYETAPNGYYNIIVFRVENAKASCPMNESSGSELHGDWQVAEGVDFPVMNWWYRVRLESNVIVEAEMKNHMSP